MRVRPAAGSRCRAPRWSGGRSRNPPGRPASGSRLSISSAILNTANRSALSRRHGVAQDRQMPGTQRAGVPLHCMATANSSGLRLGLSQGILMKTRTMPAFDRAGDIFIADRGDRACDLRLCGVGQFDDGQAGGRGHETEQAERVFQRGRALLRKRCHQRRQPVLQVSRGLRTSRSCSSKRWSGTVPVRCSRRRKCSRRRHWR